MYRITAKHDIENSASGKVMLKCNMAYECKLQGIIHAMKGIFMPIDKFESIRLSSFAPH